MVEIKNLLVDRPRRLIALGYLRRAYLSIFNSARGHVLRDLISEAAPRNPLIAI